MNREVKIENHVPENETKNKVQVKTKYWHECLHCSHWHSTKMKQNKGFEKRKMNRKFCFGK